MAAIFEFIPSALEGQYKTEKYMEEARQYRLNDLINSHPENNKQLFRNKPVDSHAKRTFLSSEPALRPVAIKVNDGLAPRSIRS